MLSFFKQLQKSDHSQKDCFAQHRSSTPIAQQTSCLKIFLRPFSLVPLLYQRIDESNNLSLNRIALSSESWFQRDRSLSQPPRDRLPKLHVVNLHQTRHSPSTPAVNLVLALVGLPLWLRNQIVTYVSSPLDRTLPLLPQML